MRDLHDKGCQTLGDTGIMAGFWLLDETAARPAPAKHCLCGIAAQELDCCLQDNSMHVRATNTYGPSKKQPDTLYFSTKGLFESCSTLTTFSAPPYSCSVEQQTRLAQPQNDDRPTLATAPTTYALLLAVSAAQQLAGTHLFHHIHKRGDQFARPAPRSPEVHQHRDIALYRQASKSGASGVSLRCSASDELLISVAIYNAQHQYITSNACML